MEQRELSFTSKELESLIREELGIFDRSLTELDALGIKKLECYDIDISKDMDKFPCFKNIEVLALETGVQEFEFLSNYKNLRILDIIYYREDPFDFSAFSELYQLEELWVSGGDFPSDVPFVGIEALTGLRKLRLLNLHEFRSVDLSFLKEMENIEVFFCGYGNEVKNIDAIGTLRKLSELELCDLDIKNIDFLKTLNRDVFLAFSALRISNEQSCELIKEFPNREIEEIEIAGKYADVY